MKLIIGFFAVAGIIAIITVTFLMREQSMPAKQDVQSLNTRGNPSSDTEDGVKLLFVGDMNFDRHIRKVILEKGEDFVFFCLGNILKDADLVVGNLEGPITGYPSISLGTEPGSPSNFIFTFPTTTAKLLARHNIKLVNLGNNHISNFGQEGILSTRKYLDEAGINYFGGINGDEPIFRTKMGGENISFISYNQFGGDSAEKVVEKIAEENRAGQLVIVYTHWGVEYSPVTVQARNIAKLFAESGASVIIGSHPHIISPSEKIGDTFVYYSLGNFIFDQYWDREVSTGLLLTLGVNNNQIEVLEHKVVLNPDGSTCLSVK